MTRYNHLLALAAGLILASASFVSAQETTRFSYEGETEIGVDSVVSSDDPTAEITDTFLSSTLALNYRLNATASVFSGFTLESVIDPTGDRAFEDIGLYVDSFGLSFDFGNSVVSVGKFAPAFGIGWDAAPGFYGNGFAGDYELGEALGATASFGLGAGDLTASLFFADNSALSKSLGTDRGRNDQSAGGVGNTGKLNNLALQYDIENGNTKYSVSASLLSAGTGDAKDQKGLAFGVVHSASENLEIIGELATLDGFAGADDRATYATIGAAYSRDAWEFSAAYTARDTRSTGNDHLVSLGADYTFSNDLTLSTGIGFVQEAGVNSTLLGVSLIIPFGS